jgi:hypothetical protein
MSTSELEEGCRSSTASGSKSEKKIKFAGRTLGLQIEKPAAAVKVGKDTIQQINSTTPVKVM